MTKMLNAVALLVGMQFNQLVWKPEKKRGKVEVEKCEKALEFVDFEISRANIVIARHSE